MKLKELRKAKGLTQKSLSEVTGISKRVIIAYEQNQRDINRAQAITLYKIAKVLDCKIEDLLEDPTE